jgi:hypothetical protein
MAIQAWDKGLREENEALKQQLMISAGEGGSPGQLYKPPVTNPGRGEAVYGTEKDGQRFFEFLKAMMINPANNIRGTGKKPLANDDDWGEGDVPGHPDWKLAHEGQHYGKHGREIADPAKGMLPSGELIHMEHMEQTPEEHKRNKEMHIKNYGQQANVNYGSPTERDKWLQLFQGPGGTLRNIEDPNLRKLILQRGAMKADAANNIRRLQPDHQTVLDDSRPGHLKIIKTFKPPKA